jgi:hypothetical protein
MCTVLFEKRIFQLLEHLRNGAIIVGDYPWCHTFRQTCLQEANKIYREDIVPQIKKLYQDTKTTQHYINIFEDYMENGCLLVGVENESGNDYEWKVDVITYCHFCLYRACYVFCNDILGQLLYDGLVTNTQMLLNLSDLCAITQQQLIHPNSFDYIGERIRRIHVRIGGNPPRF